MSTVVLTTTMAIVLGGTAITLGAQRGGAAPATSQAMAVTAVVGCVVSEGDNKWMLGDASNPIVVLATDGKSMTGSAVSIERARQEPAGKEKYRLMNMVAEFGVPQHKGERALIKGLVAGPRNDRRINLVSFEPIGPCR